MGYFDLKRLQDGSYTKPGMRGYPGLDPMQELLLEVVRDMDLEGVKRALDITGRGGALALELDRKGLDRVVATNSSAAERTALEAALIGSGAVPDGFVWYDMRAIEAEKNDLVCLILPADRGNDLVRHLVWTALEYTRIGGRALIVGDKDRGFDRYFKEARTVFGGGEILERTRGLRVARLEKTNISESPYTHKTEPFSIEARGQTLSCAAFPGTFSSGKLDPASKLLLEHLPNGAGRRALDIGAGYGVLGGFLALEGASVTMLEDDFFGAASSQLTLTLNDLEGRVLHSDVDSALEPDARFDLIVANPPFHVGADLILDVAQEFIRCAERRLAAGGEFWLVANHFLPYEPEMARIGAVREVARERGFKVLTVKKPG